MWAKRSLLGLRGWRSRICVLTMIALLRMRLLHCNGLHLRLVLLLLLLHLMLLLLMRCLRLCHGRSLLWTTLLLVLHLLLLLLKLEMLGKVHERLSSHLLPHGGHLLRGHVLHLVWETHAHAALLLEHMLLAHVLLLGVPLLLQHCRIHCLALVRYERNEFVCLLIPGCCCCCANICAC